MSVGADGLDAAALVLEEGALLCGRIERARADYPLAYGRLWHREMPRTSQRRAFSEAHDGGPMGADAHFVFGGNGTGKTWGGAQLAVAMALGRHHPAVRSWIEANGYPESRIPPRGGDVLVSCIDSGMAQHSQRPALDTWLPPGTRRHNWTGDGTAYATLPNGQKIVSKTANMGRKAYQSFKFCFAWVDEEHPSDVWDEIMERVARVAWGDGSGWVLCTMTALMGMTWVHTVTVSKPRDGYTHSEFVSKLDNPWIDRAKQRRIGAGMDAKQRAQRERGEFVELSGRVYPYDAAVNLVKSFTPDPSWPRVGVLDIGTTAPTAYLASAYDEANDVLHIYGCHYLAGETPATHAREIITLHSGFGELPPSTVLYDANTPGADVIAGEYASAGLYLTDAARKEYQAGLIAAWTRLRTRIRRDGSIGPGLLIHDHPTLDVLREEIEQHVWDPAKSRQHGVSQAATKGPDHACDGLRYLCVWFAWGGR